LKLTEINIDLNLKKLITEENIKYNTSNSLSLISKKEILNNILFFGDTKDKLILRYNIEEEKWSIQEFQCAEENFECLDYASAAVYSNGDILLTGGCHYSSYRNTASKNTFIAKIKNNIIHITSHKPMLIDRFSHGSLIIKDVPYVFGGHDGNETLSSMEYFDSNENKWKFLSFMNIEREIFAYCSAKHRYIYVFGGFNINHLDTVERYDIIYDKWKLMNFKMKRPLQNATAIELDSNKIALVGGYNGALHKCIDILDLESKTWTSLEYMKVPRRRAHVFIHRNKILIFGGESSETEVHIPEYYDPGTKTFGDLKSYDHIVSRSLNFWCSIGITI
jgi:kelch-like protein 2/3